ncbi:hypothetical protein GUITHDRAFT_164344 [Guillardia theta CCMP2712]|uniref:PUL domain-containing protein n=1 Tax=Guillardia theta (strain CCMP2712) TaxID=905079 RepID=L1IZD9_GUITC|nr:hypothetical protein GUITHDRAFT_164344 [Guillardia theta CCMP2712]EKX41638.1 hypothetical protein GUITHDRAFT_164344 [Guillardia theta CCMP2712]|eukprot:XP_005828618.1 hypothetical protein GUITHDRAFT_164344 [Guillardia theta CCMP2712]
MEHVAGSRRGGNIFRSLLLLLLLASYARCSTPFGEAVEGTEHLEAYQSLECEGGGAPCRQQVDIHSLYRHTHPGNAHPALMLGRYSYLVVQVRSPAAAPFTALLNQDSSVTDPSSSMCRCEDAVGVADLVTDPCRLDLFQSRMLYLTILATERGAYQVSFILRSSLVEEGAVTYVLPQATPVVLAVPVLDVSSSKSTSSYSISMSVDRIHPAELELDVKYVGDFAACQGKSQLEGFPANANSTTAANVTIDVGNLFFAFFSVRTSSRKRSLALDVRDSLAASASLLDRRSAELSGACSDRSSVLRNFQAVMGELLDSSRFSAADLLLQAGDPQSGGRVLDVLEAEARHLPAQVLQQAVDKLEELYAMNQHNTLVKERNFHQMDLEVSLILVESLVRSWGCGNSTLVLPLAQRLLKELTSNQLSHQQQSAAHALILVMVCTEGYEKARSSLGEPSSSKEAEDAICLSLLSICRSMTGGASREGVTEEDGTEDPTACKLLPCSRSASHQ